MIGDVLIHRLGGVKLCSEGEVLLYRMGRLLLYSVTTECTNTGIQPILRLLSILGTPYTEITVNTKINVLTE